LGKNFDALLINLILNASLKKEALLLFNINYCFVDCANLPGYHFYSRPLTHRKKTRYQDDTGEKGTRIDMGNEFEEFSQGMFGEVSLNRMSASKGSLYELSHR